MGGGKGEKKGEEKRGEKSHQTFNETESQSKIKIPQICHRHLRLPRRPGCYPAGEEKIYGNAHLHPFYYYI